MCNAAKHPPGCECGFGPPYPPGYSVSGVTEWAEEVVDNLALARRGLRDMAWDEESVREFLEHYLAITNSDLPRETMISRIRELLRMRRKVEEAISEEWINVPLYRFGAPDVEGAVVELSEGDALQQSGGWVVKVFGVGSGDTTTLQVAKSHTYTAKAGTCKVVMVPVKLKVSRIAVYDRNRLVGRGHNAQVAPLSEHGDHSLRRRECRSVPLASCCEGPTEGAEVLSLGFSHDTSGDIHRNSRSWNTDVAHEVALTLGRSVNVSALVKVTRTRHLELNFALPSGHDYVAYLCPGQTWWKSPRYSNSSSRRKSA